MRRRTILRLTGATLATAVGTGYAVTEESIDSVQGDGEPVAFEDSADLLLDPTLLPGGGWERVEMDEGDVLDVRATFDREFDAGEELEGVPGEHWIVTSAAAGRETEAEASDLYEELFADFRARVGRARLMDLELASEAAIAGYDGLTGVIFRDVNCVGSVGFTDCSDLTGCFSHVDLGEQLARTKQESWRAEPADPDVDDDEDAQPEDEEEQPDDDDDDEPGPNGDPDALELVDSSILGGDPDEEYITLRYTGEETLDMGNWRLEDDGLVPASSLSPFEFPSAFALESDAEVTVVTGEGAATDDTLYWGVGRQVWSEDGDVVRVFDQNGNLVLEESIAAELPPNGDDEPPENGDNDHPPDNGDDDPPDNGDDDPPGSDDDDPPTDDDDPPENGNDDDDPPENEDEPPDDGNDEPPDDGNDEPPDDGNDEPPDNGDDDPPDDGNDEPPDDGNDDPSDDGDTALAASSIRMRQYSS